MSRRPVALSVVALIASALVPVARAAPSKTACVEAHGDGQAQRKAGKLRAARERFLSCSDEACPAVVRRECVTWAQEVDAETSTFVVAASIDGAGDTDDVAVSVDGQLVAKRLDGRALPVDPGSHELRFETRGAPAVDERVTFRTGEKNRKLAIVFRPTPAPAASSAPPPATSEAPAVASAEAPKVSRSTLPYVLGGVGAVGLVGFAYFGLDASKKKTSLDDRGCKPACPRDDVDAVRRGYLFANVSLGVGVVGLGVATYLLLTRPKSDRTAVIIAPTRDGAVAGVVGAF